MLDPKLAAEQFDLENIVKMVIYFADRKLDIIYRNQERLDYGEYRISSMSLDNKLIKYTSLPVIIPRTMIASLKSDKLHRLEIELSRRSKVL